MDREGLWGNQIAVLAHGRYGMSVTPRFPEDRIWIVPDVKASRASLRFVQFEIGKSP